MSAALISQPRGHGFGVRDHLFAFRNLCGYDADQARQRAGRTESTNSAVRMIAQAVNTARAAGVTGTTACRNGARFPDRTQTRPNA
jgi:hypothetical protein